MTLLGCSAPWSNCRPQEHSLGTTALNLFDDGGHSQQQICTHLSTGKSLTPTSLLVRLSATKIDNLFLCVISTMTDSNYFMFDIISHFRAIIMFTIANK